MNGRSTVGLDYGSFAYAYSITRQSGWGPRTELGTVELRNNFFPFNCFVLIGKWHVFDVEPC